MVQNCETSNTKCQSTRNFFPLKLFWMQDLLIAVWCWSCWGLVVQLWSVCYCSPIHCISQICKTVVLGVPVQTTAFVLSEEKYTTLWAQCAVKTQCLWATVCHRDLAVCVGSVCETRMLFENCICLSWASQVNPLRYNYTQCPDVIYRPGHMHAKCRAAEVIIVSLESVGCCLDSSTMFVSLCNGLPM